MSRFWSQKVHQLTPYVPGEQPKIADLIKLNTNESPYGPSPRVLEALHQAINEDLRLYPDPQCTALKQALAKHTGLAVENVFVGNGSDEVLALAFQAFFSDKSAPLLFPDITYSFYPVYCQLYGIDYQQLPLTADFSIDTAAYLNSKGGIIFPNPNAPTGKALPLVEIRKLLDSNPDQVILVDEAYVDFGTESASQLIPEYPNLLVTQTFSKSWALAGLRVGFALGSPELIEGLTRVKDSFNSYPLDRLALAGATAALEDTKYYQGICQTLIQHREQLTQELETLGFEVLPSKANFVFARVPSSVKAAELANQLRAEALIVRHFNKPRIDSFLRITLGTQAQNERLVTLLKKLLTH